MNKLLKFYGHFAAAYGTQLAVQLCASILGANLRVDLWLVTLACGVYAALRMSEKLDSPKLRRFGPFAAAFGTAMLLILAICWVEGIQVRVGPGAVYGALALSALYATYRMAGGANKAREMPRSRSEKFFRLTGNQVASIGIPGLLLSLAVAWQVPVFAQNMRARQVLEKLRDDFRGELGKSVGREVNARFQRELEDAGRWTGFTAQYPFVLEPAHRDSAAQVCVAVNAALGGEWQNVELIATSPDPRAEFSDHPVLDQHVRRARMHVEIGGPAPIRPWRLRARITPGSYDLDELLLLPLLNWMQEHDIDVEVVASAEA